MEKLHFKTQTEFAKVLNMKSGSLSDVLRAKDGIGVSNGIKDRLEFLYSVSRDWLTDGIGEPFFKRGPVISETKEGVPFYDVSLSDSRIEDLLMTEDEVEYFVNYKPFNDCTAYLPVYGDSMFPKYASGEIIAIKTISNLDVLQWGEAYVVMTDEATNNLRCIKIIHQHENAEKLILRSSNPNFKGDTVIEKKHISSLYIIKGKITRNLI